MKKHEITVGGHYTARVSGNFVTVRVDRIEERTNLGGRAETHYHVTNLNTKRTTRFRSAAKFRGKAKAEGEKSLPPHPVASATPSAEAPSSSPTTFLGATKASAKDPGDERKVGDSDVTWGELFGRKPEGPLTKQMKSIKDHTERHDFIAKNYDALKTEEGDDSSDPTSSGLTTSTATPAAAVVAKSAAPASTSSTVSGLAARLAQRTTDDAPHLIVTARAGSGKTTTLVEGLKRVRGLPSTLTPSPQQEAVWRSMELSRGRVSTILFCAFNKSIAEELARRIPAGCEASTMHSLGLKAVTKAFGRVRVNSYRVSNMVVELVGSSKIQEPRERFRDLCQRKPGLISAVEQLVGLVKMNLVDPSDADALEELVSYYEVDTGRNHGEVLSLTRQVVELCKDVRRDGCLDFDDMVWLPVVLDLPCQQYDLLLGDEVQDWNRCQQALARKSGRRLVLCGDPKQAIYGFAGADAESMDRLGRELTATDRGCVELPLTVTRRCGRAIVREANKVVADLSAHESNPEGLVREARYPGKTVPDSQSFLAEVRDGDFVLCRCNAPLVSTAFKLIRQGRKANIQGRNIGAGLISLVKKLSATDVAELSGKLDDWHAAETAKENAKRNPSEAKLMNLDDKRECVAAFLEGSSTVAEVLARIDAVFTDDKASPGVRLSSIHRAKGLEADRVYLLQLKRASVPHPMAKTEWARGQEQHLWYVACTRAIRELVYVYDERPSE